MDTMFRESLPYTIIYFSLLITIPSVVLILNNSLKKQRKSQLNNESKLFDENLEKAMSMIGQDAISLVNIMGSPSLSYEKEINGSKFQIYSYKMYSSLVPKHGEQHFEKSIMVTVDNNNTVVNVEVMGI